MKILGLPKFERLGNGVKANSQHTIIKVKQKETGAIFQASVLNTSFDDQIGEQLKIISKCDDPCIIKSIGYSPTDFEGDEKTSIIYEFYSTQTLQNFITKKTLRGMIQLSLLPFLVLHLVYFTFIQKTALFLI